MIKFHEAGTGKIAEITDEEFRISSVQDAVDLLGDMYYNNCNAIVLKEINLHPDFFRLHTGLAGDILQKVSNYQFKLAVTGDFSKYTSKSFQDFIRESNRGNRIFFVENTEEAILRLKRK
jgi:hypothetical protein